MSEELTKAEQDVVKRHFGNVKRSFAGFSLSETATRSLYGPTKDDDEVDNVYCFLREKNWQQVFQKPLPHFQTVVTCHCPREALCGFIPYFISIILSDILLDDGDRIFMDSFIDRLTRDDFFLKEMKATFTSEQKRVVHDVLKFLEQTCFESVFYSDLRDRTSILADLLMRPVE